MTRLLAGSVMLGVCVALVGCGGAAPPVAPTTGTVMYKNAAVEGATVTMMTEDGEYVASGVTDAKGEFSMKTAWNGKSFDGAPIGKVFVGIAKSKELVGTGEYNDGQTVEDGADPAGAAMQAMLEQQGTEVEGGVDLSVEGLLPEKYGNPKSSGLDKTIDADGAKNVFTFNLED